MSTPRGILSPRSVEKILVWTVCTRCSRSLLEVDFISDDSDGDSDGSVGPQELTVLEGESHRDVT